MIETKKVHLTSASADAIAGANFWLRSFVEAMV